MFAKFPPSLSVPIFYACATISFIYRFLFGNIYGILITCLVVYNYSEFLFGTTPLSFDGLIHWAVTQSESTKVALLTATITVVGFLIAYATATSNWRSQLLANLKVQAAGEIEVFFVECSKLATDCKIYATAIVDGKVKSSSSRRREFRGMRRTYVRRSEHEMKRNAEIGLFTKPSKKTKKK